MIFVFIEDGTLDIINNVKDAQNNYEGIDVESGVYDFYDEKGTYLKPKFTKPNKYKKYLFGLFSTVESGEFILETSPNDQEDSFHQMLQDTQALNDNKYFHSLEELKTKYGTNT